MKRQLAAGYKMGWLINSKLLLEHVCDNWYQLWIAFYVARCILLYVTLDSVGWNSKLSFFPFYWHFQKLFFRCVYVMFCSVVSSLVDIFSLHVSVTAWHIERFCKIAKKNTIFFVQAEFYLKKSIPEISSQTNQEKNYRCFRFFSRFMYSIFMISNFFHS